MRGVQACYRRQVAALLTDAPPDTELGDGQRTYAPLGAPVPFAGKQLSITANHWLGQKSPQSAQTLQPAIRVRKFKTIDRLDAHDK